MPNPDAIARHDAPAITCTGVQLILLDIEGTTCPVSFVTETLFPYASQAMQGFLERKAQRKPDLSDLLDAVEEAWRCDDDPEAKALRGISPGDVSAYLRQLISRDSKLPALKELQGLVWRDGYANGELVAPLFPDVAEVLFAWKATGLELGVYSSGSVAAQKLLYSHSDSGDISSLFSHWFDTQMGPKQQSASYLKIARSAGTSPHNILFISDSTAECNAAHNAGITVLFSNRFGNTEQESKGFRSISDFHQLNIFT